MPRAAEAAQMARRWRQAAVDLWPLGSHACSGIPNADTPAPRAWNRDHHRSAINGWRYSSARNRSRVRVLADRERYARLQTGQDPKRASAAATNAISELSSPCLISRLGRCWAKPGNYFVKDISVYNYKCL